MTIDYDPIDGVTKADQIWKSTRGDTAQVCSRHADYEQVQRVLGPYKVHFSADLVGGLGPRARNCDRCLQHYTGAELL